jgi:general secretion pathway protein I
VSSSNAHSERWRLRRRLALGRRRVARRAVGGFTLLEALIAIVILALSLSALMQSHSTGVRGLGVLDDHLQARLLAQSVMAEWGGDRTLKPGTIEGSYGKFAWTISVAPLDDAPRPGVRAGPWTLHRLTLVVSWPRGRQIEIETVRMDRTQ